MKRTGSLGSTLVGLVCLYCIVCAGIVYSAAFVVRVPSVHGTGLDVQMASCFLENDDRATTPDETR